MYLSGALLRVGDGLRLDLRVQETGSGHVIYADKVEGTDAKAVFAMVDKATSGILAQISPGENSSLNVGASLTSNLEALKAYEEGVKFYDRFLLDDAQASLRRATQLDPNFAMAYYELAEMNFDNFEGGRREIQPAARLAEQNPLPRLQKVLIQIAQLRFDGKLQEAEQAAQDAVREFPRETEPRFAMMEMLWDQEKVGQAKPYLEEIAKLDPKRAAAQNYLAYEDVALGDTNAALADIDRYAALVPPKDPNPYDSRGDVLAISGRYAEAIAQYRLCIQMSSRLGGVAYGDPFEEEKIALAHASAGDFSQADSMSTQAYNESKGPDHASASGARADVEVTRGQFASAVGYYEEAARLFAENGFDLAKGPLIEAAQVDLEQGLAGDAMALGQRDRTPWAPAVRALTDLYLKKDSEADREFQELHKSLDPILGAYSTDKTIATVRLLGAAHAGRWQDVETIWPELENRDDKQLAALAESRAEIETGDFGRAEQKLNSMSRLGQMWGNLRYVAYTNGLSQVLARYYLGVVYEKTNRKSEAVESYQDFLKHFEHSDAKLPQIEQARAALKRLS